MGDELPVSEKAQHLVAEEELGPTGAGWSVVLVAGDGHPVTDGVVGESRELSQPE